MTVFVLLLLAVPAFALTLYPLFRPKPQVTTVRSARDEEVADLHSRRDTTYEALNDLKLEYQSGGLSERDYRDLEGKYQDRAFALMKRLDSATAPGGVEDEIEKQIMRLRKVKKETSETTSPQAGAGDEVENQIMRLRTMKRETSGASLCPSCKAVTRPGDRFCPGCGADLLPQPLACPGCKAEYQKGDRFCSKCGARL
ncbi:MAG: zinc ribbon domain-containing protein [Dehalococcoidia bacterium]|nr:zinc ribbon domain-containing protein [Dehalococcoidia bacterium]